MEYWVLWYLDWVIVSIKMFKPKKIRLKRVKIPSLFGLKTNKLSTKYVSQSMRYRWSNEIKTAKAYNFF